MNVYAVSPGRYLTLAVILLVLAALLGMLAHRSAQLVPLLLAAATGFAGVWCLRQAIAVWWQNFCFFWGPR